MSRFRRVVTLDDGETIHNALLDGKVVGFDIDNASATLDLSTLNTVALPVVRPEVA